jgi:hypothetical protein
MRSNIKNKIDYYLDKIVDMNYEVDYIRPWSTAGDIRPPYPYQWQAVIVLRAGDEDTISAVGGTPLEAVKSLYKELKRIESEEK